ncbi:hypothetical protein ACMSZT_001859 [Cronobacter dublinensis]
MEMDLDAIIAAANRAAQACDYRLSNCSRILHIGFFFDGVGRNIEHDAPGNRLSNIARLYRAYPVPEKNSSTDSYQAHYISGLGTPFDEATAERLHSMMDKSLSSLVDFVKDKPADMAKEAFHSSLGGASGKDILTEMKDTLLTPKGRLGLLKDSAVNVLKQVSIEATPWLRDSALMAYNFVTGVETRLNSAKARFERSYEEAVKNGEVPVRLISVSVFGFDMGGTLARQFIDVLLGEICDKNTGDNPTFRGVPVDIGFAGLFDCSRDTRRVAMTVWIMRHRRPAGCPDRSPKPLGLSVHSSGVNTLNICHRFRERSKNRCTWWRPMSGGAGGAYTAPGGASQVIRSY